MGEEQLETKLIREKSPVHSLRRLAICTARRDPNDMTTECGDLIYSSIFVPGSFLNSDFCYIATPDSATGLIIGPSNFSDVSAVRYDANERRVWILGAGHPTEVNAACSVFIASVGDVGSTGWWVKWHSVSSSLITLGLSISSGINYRQGCSEERSSKVSLTQKAAKSTSQISTPERVCEVVEENVKKKHGHSSRKFPPTSALGANIIFPPAFENIEGPKSHIPTQYSVEIAYSSLTAGQLTSVIRKMRVELYWRKRRAEYIGQPAMKLLANSTCPRCKLRSPRCESRGTEHKRSTISKAPRNNGNWIIIKYKILLLAVTTKINGQLRNKIKISLDHHSSTKFTSQ
ncbi:hypothetical protein I7I51_01197 [Histoplasma capsulatum]|uniref:Uncharacterized protein n=1 Tax=Ajellomyces capsulatus TaxID=5037 RepID=A0A8A1MHI9_AJECA|nr:hypothetical protein I7I51_01197 [Histoplasma capsulatum]